jgi:hypothetical protein
VVVVVAAVFAGRVGVVGVLLLVHTSMLPLRSD